MSTFYYSDWSSLDEITQRRLFIEFVNKTVTNTQVKINFHFGFQIRARRATQNAYVRFQGVTVNVHDNSSSQKTTSGKWADTGNISLETTAIHTFKTTSLRTWTYDRTTSTTNTRKLTVVAGSNSKTTDAITINVLSSHKIKYSANGATSGSAPGEQIKYYSKTLTLKTNTGSLTKTGYTFNGWNTNTAGTGTHYNSGGKYDVNTTSTSDKWLYAEWKENTDTIIYNANGGSGAPGKQTKLYTKSIKLSNIKPTRNGYKFLGWSKSASAINPSFYPDISYGSTLGHGTINLYAVWGTKFTLTRTLGTGEIEKGSYPSSGEEIEKGSSLNDYLPNMVLKEAVNNYSKYKFDNWIDTDGITYSSNDYMPAKDLSLITAWESHLANIYKCTAIRSRSSVVDNSIIFTPDDSGNQCILRFIFDLPKLYKYIENEEQSEMIVVDNTDIYAPIVNFTANITNAYEKTSDINIITGKTYYILIKETFKEVETPLVADLNKYFEKRETLTITFTNNDLESDDSFNLKNLNSNNSDKIIYFNSQEKSDIEVIISSLVDFGENEIIDLTGDAKSAVDFLSKTTFTIDISADGDRLGIFKGVEDSDETVDGKLYEIVSNPSSENISNYYELIDNKYIRTSDITIINGKTYYIKIKYPKQQVDLNGDLILRKDLITQAQLIPIEELKLVDYQNNIITTQPNSSDNRIDTYVGQLTNYLGARFGPIVMLHFQIYCPYQTPSGSNLFQCRITNDRYIPIINITGCTYIGKYAYAGQIRGLGSAAPNPPSTYGPGEIVVRNTSNDAYPYSATTNLLVITFVYITDVPEPEE